MFDDGGTDDAFRANRASLEQQAAKKCAGRFVIPRRKELDTSSTGSKLRECFFSGVSIAPRRGLYYYRVSVQWCHYR
jgi:hypothetical protein